MQKGKIAKDVDNYLAGIPAEERAVLERLRKIIRATAPQAVETIGYGMPAYKHQGVLVYFAAFKNHCSFFPASAAVIRAHAAELARFETAKGTIRFTPDRPLAAALVRKIVRARLAENEARKKKKPGIKGGKT
jgi:uncharacterized protein YdhG (YjbR/CyaY superfamily)